MITDIEVVRKRAEPYIAAGKLLMKDPRYKRAIREARKAQIAWVGGEGNVYVASILAAALPYLKENA